MFRRKILETGVFTPTIKQSIKMYIKNLLHEAKDTLRKLEAIETMETKDLEGMIKDFVCSHDIMDTTKVICWAVWIKVTHPSINIYGIIEKCRKNDNSFRMEKEWAKKTYDKISKVEDVELVLKNVDCLKKKRHVLWLALKNRQEKPYSIIGAIIGNVMVSMIEERTKMEDQFGRGALGSVMNFISGQKALTAEKTGELNLTPEQKRYLVAQQAKDMSVMATKDPSFGIALRGAGMSKDSFNQDPIASWMYGESF